MQNEMRDRLIELVCDKIQDGHCIGYCNHPPCSQCKDLADYILADGWIRPPCKVGDKVYCIEYNLKIIEEYTVSGYTIKNGKLALFVFRGIYSAVVSEWFLTKEEAEAKLKELGK